MFENVYRTVLKIGRFVSALNKLFSKRNHQNQIHNWNFVIKRKTL